MSDFSDLWDIERQLWTGPAGDYASLMTEDCIMVFPLPAGILKRDDIIKTVTNAPRWDDIEFDKQNARQAADGTVVLAYVGRGLQGSNGYEAFCSSTYVKDKDGWRIALHHQTPA